MGRSCHAASRSGGRVRDTTRKRLSRPLGPGPVPLIYLSICPVAAKQSIYRTRTNYPTISAPRMIGRLLVRRRCLCSSNSSVPRRIYESDELLVRSLAVTPFQMNQYLLGCKQSGEAALIDTGDSIPQRWIDAASEDGLTIRHILLTHAHVDHVAGLAETKALLPDAPSHLHPADGWTLLSAPAQGMMFGLSCPTLPAADVDLQDEAELCIGSLRLRVMHTPGHAPGHVVFHLPKHDLLFSGDLLFRRSIGRTDFPGCDPAKMEASLRRVLELPGCTRVFPGHMEQTTIEAEAQSNPFLQGLHWLP